MKVWQNTHRKIVIFPNCFGNLNIYSEIVDDSCQQPKVHCSFERFVQDRLRSRSKGKALESEESLGNFPEKSKKVAKFKQILKSLKFFAQIWSKR